MIETTREQLEELLDPLWSEHPVWRSIDTGDGWNDLIRDLATELSALPISWEIVQIKEKFGGLRFYINSDDWEITNPSFANTRCFPFKPAKCAENQEPPPTPTGSEPSAPPTPANLPP